MDGVGVGNIRVYEPPGKVEGVCARSVLSTGMVEIEDLFV